MIHYLNLLCRIRAVRLSMAILMDQEHQVCQKRSSEDEEQPSENIHSLGSFPGGGRPCYGAGGNSVGPKISEADKADHPVLMRRTSK